MSTLHISAIKLFLDVCIDLYAFFALWLIGWTNWYLMFMVVVFRFKAVDASMSMKWKPGWIPQLFKSSVKYLKYLIVSLSLIFIVVVVRTYIK